MGILKLVAFSFQTFLVSILFLNDGEENRYPIWKRVATNNILKVFTDQ
jgi:hypothetical protein